MNYDIILDNLKSYTGTGLLFILLTVSVTYLGIKFKDSGVKYMMFWYPIAVLLVYFCPIWILYSIKRNDSDILYRIMWLMPVGIVIATAFTEFVFSLPKKYRGVGTIIAVLVIILSGQYIYANKQFTKAENIHHMPDEVIEICNVIETPGREVRACVPDELLQYVRQYSSFVHLTYGRDILLSGESALYSDLHDLLNEECPQTEAIVMELRDSYTPYLVISSDKILDPPITDFDFKYVASAGKYDIFLDEHANVTLIFDD